MTGLFVRNSLVTTDNLHEWNIYIYIYGYAGYICMHSFEYHPKLCYAFYVNQTVGTWHIKVTHPSEAALHESLEVPTKVLRRWETFKFALIESTSWPLVKELPERNFSQGKPWNFVGTWFLFRTFFEVRCTPLPHNFNITTRFLNKSKYFASESRHLSLPINTTFEVNCFS